jgi:hypothetical protein
MPKGDWVLPGTTLWVSGIQPINTLDNGEITNIGISYFVELPSGLSIGYSLQYPLPVPLPQAQIMQALADAINAVLAFEGLPL